MTSTRRSRFRGIQSADEMKTLALRIGEFRAVAETNDARVLEEPPDDRFDADVLRHARHAGPQAANAAHHQIDFHALVGGAIERVDDLGMHQRVELGPDGAVAAGLGVGDLVFDQLQQRLLHVDQRRHGDLFQLRRARIAGDEIEQAAGVAARWPGHR